MDINLVHWYSHLGENLLCLIYDALGVKLTETLEVWGSCPISKSKVLAVRNKMQTRATKPVERIFVDTIGPFP